MTAFEGLNPDCTELFVGALAHGFACGHRRDVVSLTITDKQFDLAEVAAADRGFLLRILGFILVAAAGEKPTHTQMSGRQFAHAVERRL